MRYLGILFTGMWLCAANCMETADPFRMAFIAGRPPQDRRAEAAALREEYGKRAVIDLFDNRNLSAYGKICPGEVDLCLSC